MKKRKKKAAIKASWNSQANSGTLTWWTVCTFAVLVKLHLMPLWGLIMSLCVSWGCVIWKKSGWRVKGKRKFGDCFHPPLGWVKMEDRGCLLNSAREHSITTLWTRLPFQYLSSCPRLFQFKHIFIFISLCYRALILKCMLSLSSLSLLSLYFLVFFFYLSYTSSAPPR